MRFYLLLFAEILGSWHIFLLKDSVDRAVWFANLISGKKVFL